MRFVCMLVAAALTACGGVNEELGQPSDDVPRGWCGIEGDTCVASREMDEFGVCRMGAWGAWTCCLGCWDVDRCRSGTDAPMCGANGEDCAAAKCP